jgi:probable biosynthetic protein (TIGR04098 family)
MTNRSGIERRVREIVSEVAKIHPASLQLDRWVTAYGVDSLQLLVLREALESGLQVHIPDNVWLDLGSVAALIAFVEGTSSSTAGSGGVQAVQHAAAVAPLAHEHGGARLSAEGLFYEDIEIGMPLTGLNNLAEGPLLQRLGDHRWRHLSGLMGVPSKAIVDEEGERLYPTFFYVEVGFPAERPMACYGENDRLKAVSAIARFGTSMLDGVSFLMPPDHPEGASPPFPDVASARAAGVPAVRLSNIFVKQFAGAEWLKKSRPVADGFTRIPLADAAPDSYAIVKQAERDGFLARPDGTWLPMTDGPVTCEHHLVPDRDLNGARLVYFANYPVFLDICERQALASARLALSQELLDRRTLVHRRSAYLNNASFRDSLFVEVEAWVQNPWTALIGTPAEAPARLLLNFRMFRRSDRRLMMVSTAEKILFGVPCGELPFAPLLERASAQDNAR